MAEKKVDKGITRYGVRECLETNKKITLLSLGLGVIIAIQFVFMFYFQENIKYFIVDRNKRVAKLEQIDKNFKLTTDSVYDYVQKAMISVLSLTYDKYKIQLANTRTYFSEKVYKELVKALNQSNYIPLMLKYHRSYYAIPTPDVYKIQPLGNKKFRVFRSFMIKSLGDDGISQKMVYYAIDVKLVKRSQLFYAGMEIINVHQITGDTAINSLLHYKDNRR